MIKQTVGDFVAVYNQLKKSLVAASSLSGPTAGLRELERELGGLLHTVVSSHGSINQPSDIGISTPKDGLLSADNAKPATALEAHAGAVAALFNPRRAAAHNDQTDPVNPLAPTAVRPQRRRAGNRTART